MASSTIDNFVLGTAVHVQGGKVGVLNHFIMHPIGRVLTHLVVERNHQRHSGRLVPIALVESNGATTRLSCTHAEYENLAEAEQKLFLAGGKGFSTRSEAFYRQERIARPPYGSSMSPITTSVASAFVNNVPVDEVKVKGRAQIRATDGWIGELRGLIVNPLDHHVTYVLVRAGHLRRARNAAISINAVKSIGGDSIHLSVSKEQVRYLPQNGALESFDADETTLQLPPANCPTTRHRDS